MKYIIAVIIAVGLAAGGFFLYTSRAPSPEETTVSHSCKDLSVVVFMSPYCKYCTMAKDILDKFGVEYRSLDVHADTSKRQTMLNMTGQSSVPQIFFEGKHIGGYSNLFELQENGKLKQFLKTCDPTTLQ